MARRSRNTVPDTQLAFDLWGVFEETEQSNERENQQAAVSAVTGSLAGDGRLFDEGWADQQRPDDDARNRVLREPHSGLVGASGNRGERSGEGTEPDAHSGVTVRPWGERAFENDDTGVPGAATGVRVERERGDALPSGLVGDRPELRGAGGLEVSAGQSGGGSRRATLSFTRAGIDAEEVGGSSDAQLLERHTTGDTPASVSRSASDQLPSPRSGQARIVGGLAAVVTLQQILREGREPSVTELAELRRFPGWGATPELFDPKSTKYEAEREALNEIWSPEDWRAARRTVLNAHYTNPAYVDAMWGALERLGVPSDAAILEPGCGSGNFIGKAPIGARMTGVELDPTTAKIAGLLHPEASILNESFAETRLSGDGFDATIGNVPFGQVSLHDPAYNSAGLSLHNHFIVKSLRMTKPGGVVAVMSSRWTMDAKSERARREIAKHGELLGAVRMPAGAHGETAGTDALIDVLVFRKYADGEEVNETPHWVQTVDVDGAAGAVQMNAYFVDQPEMVLGTVNTRIGRFGPEITVTAPDVSAAAIAPQLDTALKQITTEAVARGRGWAAAHSRVSDRPAAHVLQDQATLVGRVYVSEAGELETVGLSGPIPLNVPKNAQAEVRALIELRDVAVALLDAEAATTEDTPEIAALRADLNRVYDGVVQRFGPLGRFTETVREREGKEPIVTRRYPAALKALRTDPHFATVVALERYNEQTGVAKKATIFSKRVVAPQANTVSVETPEDAMLVSLDRSGTVDIPLIAELLNVREQEAVALLGNKIFLSPALDETYLPAEVYLSGNVRQKLVEARQLAEEDTRFLAHVTALEQVIPQELGPAEINVKFGAGWVPTDVVAAFIEHELGKPTKAVEHIDGEWKFDIRGAATSVAEAKWAAHGKFASDHAKSVFKQVLGGKQLKMTYKVDDKQFVDLEGTEALNERAAELHEAFQDWLWKDPERAEQLQTRYNDLYNGIVLRSYDGIKLSFPGIAASFNPYPHQHAAVARMLAEPSAGLFHEVGAGKTAEMVMGVMELRRLGLVKKPAIVVPNQMLEQFTREFKQIYPRAKVLFGGTSDLSASSGKDARKLFVRRAQTNDWDCVILTHSAFEKIGLGESAKAYAEEKLAEMTEVHLQKLNSTLSKDSVKKLEQQIHREEEKLKKMLDLDWDEGVCWEDTGIDYLCVDEAHLFKNLTVHSSVPDLSKEKGSNRAQDLDMKLWYHREHLKQSHVATLATATPLPNSMIEMYVMMRYLRPDLLEAAEVLRADDWATQFTEQVTAIEPKLEGGGFAMKTRTTKFRNLPELLNMWHVSGDVKTQADLDLDVPLLEVNSDGRRVPEMVIVPATTAQHDGMTELIERAELVRNRQVQPEEDNLLKITSDGRAIALDARLRDREGPLAEETTKIEVVADRVAKIWNDTKHLEFEDEWGDVSETPGALQIVFSDLGTPQDETDKWDVYTHLRDGLVARGMPREKIKFIHEATNDKAKEELFQQCRDGRVSVLVGSTSKMGVGTNVQTRAVALHHIDAPWRPADVTQREGRIIRQKNQNAQVQVIRYSTEGSFDAYMWGTLARKAAFIEQVLAGRLDVREADNSSEMALQFAEMQAITIGDMRILEMANLKQDTQKLGRQERAHQRKIDAIYHKRRTHEQIASSLERDIECMKKILPNVVETHGEAFTATVKRASWSGEPKLNDRKEFGNALKHQIGVAYENLGYGFGPHNQNYPKPIAVKVNVGGIDWDTHLRWNPVTKSDPIIEFHADGAFQALTFEMRMSRLNGGDVVSLSRPFEQRATGLADRIQEDELKATATREAVAEMLVMEKEPWAHKDDLVEKQQRLTALVDELAREENSQQSAGTSHVQAPPHAHSLHETTRLTL